MALTGYSRSQANVVFPYGDSKDRLEGYDFYEKLFEGEHFAAFNMKLRNASYMQEMAKIRFIVANFAGLISKVCADMLFSEAPTIRVKDPKNQEFIEALIFENHLNIQNYESALSNSYNGDAVYKIRTGKRNPKDTEDTIIIEDNIPHVYFPELESNNTRALPKRQELAFKIRIGDKDYLRKEIHEVGKIYNELWLMKGNALEYKVSLSLLGDDIPDEQDTGVDRYLIQHVPNWKTGKRFFGYSDYYDLSTIFFALDNRFTKIDNILDNHSDPILAVPEGILDEHGKVKREYLKMVEMPPSTGGEKPQKPEYVVWDASLASAFTEIDKLVEVLFMVSETSPDILGMGKGTSDSGRALKLKILRTIAKVNRKKLYYDRALKEILYTAQLLSIESGYKVDGKQAVGTPEVPEIIWSNGMPMDSEDIDDEVKRLDAGLTTTKDAMMRLDNLSEAQAEEKAKEVEKEKSIEMPTGNPAVDVGRFKNAQ